MSELDAVDRRLLSALQADGRASWAALGAQVGLSAPAVRQRVQRMTEAGVLQVVAVTDPIALGHPVMAMLAVSVTGDVREVADRLDELSEVIYTVLTSGPQDLLVEVVCRTMEELLALVNDQVRTVPGVGTVVVSPYFRIRTHRFTWGAGEG